MDCSWPETSPSPSPFDRRKSAAEELLRGREFAQQLRSYLRRSYSSEGGGTASDDLVSRILTSFSKTISILNRSGDSVSGSDEINNGSVIVGTDSLDEHEESGDSCKSSSTYDVRRGYKRRSRNGHSWVKDSCRLVEDGHGWRKYGQKKILHAKYPRNYYRCTHKFEQGCQATKQVQQLENENPPKFRTTYYGHHTCTNSDIVLGGGSSGSDNSFNGILLNFQNPSTMQPQPPPHSLHDNKIKNDNQQQQQQQRPVITADDYDDDVCCSFSDYITAGVGSSPDNFSEVLMPGDSVLQFEDDVLSFRF